MNERLKKRASKTGKHVSESAAGSIPARSARSPLGRACGVIGYENSDKTGPPEGLYSIRALHQTVGNQAVQRLFQSGAIQRKLTVGKPNDICEQKADRMAEQVMRMPETSAQRQSRAEEAEEVRTQRQATAYDASISEAPPLLHEALSTPGQPLDTQTRAFFEPRFEYDFSGVRVHVDAKADKSAKAVAAKAYTMGQDIVFGKGHYHPATQRGRELIAHELTHVVQQDRTASVSTVQRREDPEAPVAPEGAALGPASAPPSTSRPSPGTRTEHDVYVIDFGVNRDVVNWREAILHIGEIEAESVDQMVRDVKAEVGHPDRNCIRTLTLDGHGSPGNMSVGDGTGWVEGRHISTEDFRPTLAELIPYFCSGATVVLLGCNVGRGPTGARFIQALADYWQVNVAAATGEVDGFGIQGVWVWGLPGQVLPSDTMLIVDQIVRILDETTYGDDEEMIFEILEASDARGSLTGVRSELVRQGRWDGLCRDLRYEDSARFNRLFPEEPTPSVRLRHPSEIELPPPWTGGAGSIF